MLCALSAALPSVLRLFLPEFRTLSTVPFPVFHNPDTVSQPDKPLSRQDVSNDFSVVFPFFVIVTNVTARHYIVTICLSQQIYEFFHIFFTQLLQIIVIEY